MKKRVPRDWLRFCYLDPQKILVGLRDIERKHAMHELRYHARTLRTRELRSFGEGRQAALFCYGMSQALGLEVTFAQVEQQDFDFVARYESGGEMHYVPVQLKEWVPDHLPDPQPLQAELNKLAKYADAQDLVVAFYLNRAAHVDLTQLSYPRTIGELWFFGASDEGQQSWILIGDVLRERVIPFTFAYPQA